MPDNSLNTGKGRLFQERAAKILGEYLGVKFKLDVAIEIGQPVKSHRFDLVSEDGTYVGECKNYCWTETGNMPSAKMAFLNEAVFYLSHLPGHAKRFIAMRADRHLKRKETLASYYVRTYHHLLSGIDIYELDIDQGVVSKLGILKDKPENAFELVPNSVSKVAGQTGCRPAILAAAHSLLAAGNPDFSPMDIVAELKRTGSPFKESTIRTHVVSRMCANAPHHHGTTFNDLERLRSGRYRLKA